MPCHRQAAPCRRYRHIAVIGHITRQRTSPPAGSLLADFDKSLSSVTLPVNTHPSFQPVPGADIGISLSAATSSVDTRLCRQDAPSSAKAFTRLRALSVASPGERRLNRGRRLNRERRLNRGRRLNRERRLNRRAPPPRRGGGAPFVQLHSHASGMDLSYPCASIRPQISGASMPAIRSVTVSVATS